MTCHLRRHVPTRLSEAGTVLAIPTILTILAIIFAALGFSSDSIFDIA
jgi:hypothetical protein